MPLIRQVSFQDIIARGIIKDTDVLAMRRKFYEDGRIAVEEIENLFALDAACPVQDAAWPLCFIEMVTDYVVSQARPAGYVTMENADWLLGRIAKGGRIGTKTNLDLLINVIDKARWVPEPLAIFALEQVAAAIEDGLGPMRDRNTGAAPGTVTANDVEWLRRILYAYAGDANVAISRAEADVLFAINDMTANAQNTPDWTDLFMKAIANHVLAASGYAVPSREEALARDRWLDQRGEAGPVAIAQSILGELAGYRPMNELERELVKLERIRVSIVTQADVSAPEVEWLSARLARDGKLTENEVKLLEFLAAEGPAIDPSLEAIVGRLRKAA